MSDLFKTLGAALRPEPPSKVMLTICSCDNIDVGSYGNQVTISDLPEHMAKYKAKQGGAPDSICIDRCIVKEVRALWAIGITTTGCCCGHNKVPAFIGVIDSDIPKMKALGYEVVYNNCRPGDEDSFLPKSIMNVKTPQP